MRGKKKIPERKIDPDPKYGRVIIAKFINYIMRRGKKTVAQKIVYQAFDIIKERTKKDPLEVFDSAIRNVSPEVEVRSRRIGGANYQIPVYTNEKRRLSLAFRWIIQAAKAKKGKAMAEKLAEELIEASENQGAAVKKKEEVYKMAQANRAFAHFAGY